jgi:hypothetical protein
MSITTVAAACARLAALPGDGIVVHNIGVIDRSVVIPRG